MLRKLYYYKNYGYKLPYLTMKDTYEVIKYELDRIEEHITNKQNEYNKQREKEKQDYMSFVNMLNTLYNGNTDPAVTNPIINGLGNIFDSINNPRRDRYY